jgi:uncharacterized membrane protein YeaQ/YmgE (transglycosylase-associated protein family)
MHIIWSLIIGLIVGAVAKLLMPLLLPGKEPTGFLVTMLLGVAGSFVGTMFGRAIGLYEEGRSAGFIVSVLGAMALLALYHLFVGRRSTAG